MATTPDTGIRNNHPNRNWRARMDAACEAFLDRWRWPAQTSVGVLSPDELRAVMAQAYEAGYTDGRQSTRPARNDRTAI